MTAPRKYMAASVPRSLRQTRLSYLPQSCLIGSRFLRGDSGDNLVYDIVMLPVKDFQRMRANVGLQHVFAPALRPSSEITPAYIPQDIKEVVVPAGEADPLGYAKSVFAVLFGLVAAETPLSVAPDAVPRDAFVKVAVSCVGRDERNG